MKDKNVLYKPERDDKLTGEKNEISFARNLLKDYERNDKIFFSDWVGDISI